jgi:TRAP transporter TAXI family solute receptor
MESTGRRVILPADKEAMRRIWLIILAGGFALAGMTAFVFHYYAQPTTLRIAVGPPKGEDARLLAAIAGQLGRDRASVRLRIVEKGGPEDTATAIDKNEADLAVVRHDLAMPTTGQAVAILRREVIAIIAMPGVAIEKISDLAGRKVGVIGRGRKNLALLDTVLLQYDIHQVQAVPVDPDDIAAAAREGVEVIFVTSSLTGRTITEAIAIASRDGAPKFIAIDESEAIAQRHPTYESKEIVAGAFGASKPSETIETIGLSYYIMARNSLGEDLVGEVARLLLAVRPILAAEFPAVNRIEAPATDKDAPVAVHPGAAAYYDGEQKTFFDRYGDMIYWLVMLLSLAGSGAAALAGYAKAGDRGKKLVLLNRLLDLMKMARQAENVASLDRIETEADEILATAVGEAEKHDLDQPAMAAYSLALDQLRAAVADRRAALMRPAARPRAVRTA